MYNEFTIDWNSFTSDLNLSIFCRSIFAFYVIHLSLVWICLPLVGVCQSSVELRKNFIGFGLPLIGISLTFTMVHLTSIEIKFPSYLICLHLVWICLTYLARNRGFYIQNSWRKIILSVCWWVQPLSSVSWQTNMRVSSNYEMRGFSQKQVSIKVDQLVKITNSWFKYVHFKKVKTKLELFH